MRPAINAHQRANRKEPKGKYPIKKGGKYYQKERKMQKERSKSEGKEGDINVWTSMRERLLLFVCFSLPAHCAKLGPPPILLVVC